MTVKVSKPAINVREELADLKKPTGIAGEAMLRAETPQEQFNLIGAGRRNLIINGDMNLDQRNSGSAISSLGQYTTYTVDRWNYYSDQAGKFSFQQNQSSVTPPVGFAKYLGLTSLSAFSAGTNESLTISQHVEGFNSAQLNWGTSSAKTCTLSFYVRSSLTGTFSGALVGGQNYIFTYSISSANTWEYKTITITGSTTGTWNTDNTSGVRVLFTLGYGSGQVGTANAWQSADLAASGSVQVAGTSGATFYLTGVQLEVGKVATPFEHRFYGEELALCQRYFWKILGGKPTYYAFQYSTGNKFMVINHPVEMRATPAATITFQGGSMTSFHSDRQHYKAFVGSTTTDTAVHYITEGAWNAEL